MILPFLGRFGNSAAVGIAGREGAAISRQYYLDGFSKTI